MYRTCVTKKKKNLNVKTVSWPAKKEEVNTQVEPDTLEGSM